VIIPSGRVAAALMPKVSRRWKNIASDVAASDVAASDVAASDDTASDDTAPSNNLRPAIKEIGRSLSLRPRQRISIEFAVPGFVVVG